ncbi:hypothetical protein K402DRAFT_247142 [Aulographum hederae CBS 113979]|uniref:Uncharacterized protein n=1 Tax=Aulographum hederae CBS 113979 TaxID=1176131 RepID=A0A6G1HA04_9PEZI|nr:hypothetical protein K402DRAFT_247142 [Aulographum hederae CBS 113979]
MAAGSFWAGESSHLRRSKIGLRSLDPSPYGSCLVCIFKSITSRQRLRWPPFALPVLLLFSVGAGCWLLSCLSPPRHLARRPHTSILAASGLPAARPPDDQPASLFRGCRLDRRLIQHSQSESSRQPPQAPRSAAQQSRTRTLLSSKPTREEGQ